MAATTSMNVQMIPARINGIKKKLSDISLSREEFRKALDALNQCHCDPRDLFYDDDDDREPDESDKDYLEAWAYIFSGIERFIEKLNQEEKKLKIQKETLESVLGSNSDKN